MKYIARELLSGPDFPDESREIEIRECKDATEASKFVEEILNKGLELRIKRNKTDYGKTLQVELYFERKSNE